MKKINTKIRSFIEISDGISLLNMSFGFLSIINSINNELNTASILMLIAIIFDSIDGWIARKTNRNDELGFGKNIDSFSDIISFGIAPAILIYSFNSSLYINSTILTIVCLLIVICGILRLARYNVLANKLDSNAFIGLPIPTIACLLSTYYLSGLFNLNYALIISVITSILMISNIKYPKIENKAMISICAILLIWIMIPQKTPFNIPAILLLIITLSYLLINLIKTIVTPNN